MTERIYGLRELTRILTLTPRRAGQLKRLNLLHGELRYTFRELLALRAAAALLDSGASVRQIRQALDALRPRDPQIPPPPAQMRLVLHGGRALGEAGDCAEAAYNLGSLNEDTGDVDEAIRCYHRALDVSPDYADAHFNLAGALARAGRGDEAVKHWQRYLELDAGSPWAKIARAHLEVVERPGETSE